MLLNAGNCPAPRVRQVHSDRRQKEQRTQNIFPLRNPGCGLDMQRMETEQQTGRRTGKQQGKAVCGAAALETALSTGCFEKPQGQDYYKARVHGVKNNIREVVAEGIQSPDCVIKGVGKPRQGMPVGRIEIEERPVQELEIERSDVWIIENVRVVIQNNELVLERGKINDTGDRSDGRSKRVTYCFSGS